MLDPASSSSGTETSLRTSSSPGGTMVLTPDLIKQVFDDIRAAQKSITDLLLFQDQQALNIMRLYLTATIAIASGAVASYSSQGKTALFAGLIVSFVPLSVGIIFCFQAAKQIQFGGPGRHPSFWIWAIDPTNNTENVVRKYIEGEQEKMMHNRDLSNFASHNLTIAKWCGLACPILFLIVGVGYSLKQP